MAIEFNLPTYITLLRVALIPLLMLIFYVPWEYSNIACTAVFILAGITDWLDGYLARKLKMETPFGAFLDPVADKLMVAMVLVIIVERQADPFLAIPAAIIIGREITIASLREWMATIGQQATVKVSMLAKWKTGIQMISLGLLLYHDTLFSLPIEPIGYALLYTAALLAVWSMIDYLNAAFTALTKT
ncbi:MAG: CDP-diacylglycerol--glycerol-3-phosphate 3-phosphatidyltransferase [Methylococcaceae bacterium]|nr:MAG: CDP-diacylglycerol--glycerol-3-phosphate 3-phosphatidyltransferase [Methylococcaceae bacterium]